jgi:hypothetical protein
VLPLGEIGIIPAAPFFPLSAVSEILDVLDPVVTLVRPFGKVQIDVRMIWIVV